MTRLRTHEREFLRALCKYGNRFNQFPSLGTLLESVPPALASMIERGFESCHKRGFIEDNPRDIIVTKAGADFLLRFDETREKWDWSCSDCIDPEPLNYMVSSEVWQQALEKGEARFLCFPCLEKRLGRPLRQRDFPMHIPLNSFFENTLEAIRKLEP